MRKKVVIEYDLTRCINDCAAAFVVHLSSSDSGSIKNKQESLRG